MQIGFLLQRLPSSSTTVLPSTVTLAASSLLPQLWRASRLEVWVDAFHSVWREAPQLSCAANKLSLLLLYIVNLKAQLCPLGVAWARTSEASGHP